MTDSNSTSTRMAKAAEKSQGGMLAAAKAAVGTAMLKAGVVVAHGATKMSDAAKADAHQAQLSGAAESAKASLKRATADGVGMFKSGQDMAKRQRQDATIADAKATVYGVRAKIDNAASAVTSGIANAGMSVAGMGDKLTKPAKPASPANGPAPPSLGASVVNGLAAAAKAIASRGNAGGERIVNGSNGMNKPHPVVQKDSKPAATPEGKPRGFQNARNQAAAQRAKGNNYSGPSD